jgi:hypothetical protein
MLSDQLIEEFRVLMREQYNIELSISDARRLGEWLVQYYKTLIDADAFSKEYEQKL